MIGIAPSLILRASSSAIPAFALVRQAWRVVPEGTVRPGWYPADDLEVGVLCGPWVWEPLAEQQGCPERSGI